MKILTVVGARPQFIKAAAVSRIIAEHDGVTEVIVHTGQHYDTNMSDIFFKELSITPPDHHLGIGGGTHGAMTGQQLEAIERVLIEEKADRVLVYGDTNSTLAGALAAVKLHIPVLHVEAGLRSFNRRMPEEINRILTDHASDLLFTPTEEAMSNLRHEGLPEACLHLVGDVMYDATLFYKERSRIPDWFPELKLPDENFVLATIHRAENVDDPIRLRSILNGLVASGKPVILPLHPRTRARMAQQEVRDSNIHFVDPVGYLEMVWLETRATLIATDSGGVQKEAYFHKKPCVTLRDETEWVELVEAGWNTLVGASEEKIATALNTPDTPHSHPNYGDGNAAQKILKVIME